MIIPHKYKYNEVEKQPGCVLSAQLPHISTVCTINLLAHMKIKALSREHCIGLETV